MKTNIRCLGAMALTAALLPLSYGARPDSAQTQTYDPSISQPRTRQTDSKANRIGAVVRSTKAIGSEVRNTQNEKLGKITDMIVDVEAGKVVNVIVATGGVLGVGDKQVVLSPQAFSADEDGIISLNLDKSEVKNASKFDAENWSDDPKIGRGFVDQAKGPNFRNPERGAVFVPPPVRYGTSKLATKLVGFPVKNGEGESIGKVDNLTVDLPAGRVVQVVVAAGGYLGTPDELNFVPPESFKFSPERDALVLNVTKDMLSSAPRFKNSNWPDVSDRYGSAEIYKYYKIDPYFNPGTTPAPTEQAVDTKQGTEPLDKALLANVEASIRQADGLSVNARNVKVIARDGRLTFIGPVDSQADRQKLSEIALRYVDVVRFNSLLTVQNSAANR